MKREQAVSVLFVCMGNICRSPTAHGVFRKLVSDSGLEGQISTDSAGTHAYHIGEGPDKRSQATAIKRDIDISDLRARQAETEDFHQFDYVIAMDEDNLRSLSSICPGDMEYKLRLFMDFAPQMQTREVPDPYYGGGRGFERVFDLVEAASIGLLEDIRSLHLK